MSQTKTSFMDKFQAVMEKYVVPVGMKISGQRHLSAIRDGLTVMIAVTVIGGFACLLAVPPIPATITEPSNFFYAMLLAWKSWAAANTTTLMLPYQLSIGIISVYVVMGVSYQLAKSYKMEPVNNMVGALFIFLCVSNVVNFETSSLTIGRLGANYMFGAMMIALLVVEINHFFMEKKIVIKLPSSVPPNVAAPFNMLIPMIFSVVAFVLLNAVCNNVTGDGLTGLVFKVFQPLMKATGSLPSILLINFLMTTFWFFGIHGGNMVAVVVSPITTAGLAANMEAYMAGQPMEYIFAGSVNSIFGNWITYTAMLVVIFTLCKSSQLKSIAKVAIVPSCFNINEPSIFGIPTVLNVYTYIPMLMCSVINFSAYYLLASAGIVGKFYVTLPFTVPGPLAAFLGTTDAKTILLWCVLFAVDYMVLNPFIRTYDKQLLEAEAKAEA
ncbi:MAG: PTS sugar transporter subunit IIC [Lachnospiraceae bacterium]|jgi:PTS system cellobiose-specific IIC component|nr:PTS sugar transporter subunit IIC [Lachnospiraceae bacterium]